MKFLFITFLLCSTLLQFSYPQNTFPGTGNVGIGTTSPVNNLQIGTQAFASTATPVTLSLGATSSNVAGANPKLKLFDDGTNISGFGISSGQIDAIVPSGGNFAWYVNGSQKMILTGAGNIGIGTTSPTSKVQILTLNDNSPNNIGSTNFDGRHFAIGSTGANASAIAISKNSTAGGSAYISSATIGLSWDPIGFQAGAYNWYLGGATTPIVVITPSGNLLIGESSQINTAYKLDVAGNVRANQIVVNSTGADFVFEPTYRLHSLSNLKKYINQNHHLPEIPSAKQMQAEGLNVGDNQIKLLQKVEELTLYLIEKDKQLNKQQTQIDLLIRQVAELSKAKTEQNEKYILNPDCNFNYSLFKRAKHTMVY